MVVARLMRAFSCINCARLLFGLSAAASISPVLAQTNAPNGRALFMDERKGNCVACHKTPTDASLKSASSIGPALESIKQKYPAPADRIRLRNVIIDSSKFNPATSMPPYGTHRILTEVEIDAIVAYLETL